MAANRFHERIMPKIQKLDPQNMQNYIQHLAREHGFLESIFNTIQEAVLVIDEDLKIRYHNNAAKEMLGLPDELKRITVNRILKGINWRTLLPRENCGSHQALRQELELFYPEHRIVQFYALPLNRREKMQYALILNDITATLQKAASTAESERSKIISMLAAGVAHEIGNPLNSLYLHLQFFQRMLARDQLDPQEALEEITEARKEVERLDSIINQFLHAIRPGKPKFQVVNLKDLVLEALNFMRHEIQARDVCEEVLWDNDIPLISGDPNQLKQMFYNLVKNAVQSMVQGGRLSIHCHANEEFVMLSVSDSGCGISREALSQIFTPYFTTKGSGTGLGLMIVERIVREHGASLSVDSEEREGTTFTVSFPRRERTIKVLPPPEEILNCTRADGEDIDD